MPLTHGNDITTEPTLRRQPEPTPIKTDQECCLVQIYPPDIVDGMLLLEQDEFHYRSIDSIPICRW